VVSFTEAFQRAVALAFYMEVPTASAAASNLDLTMGKQCWKTDLEVAGARNLHLVAARIELEAVVATWKVARLLKILPMASRLAGYSENPVTGKVDSCLII
jgi:hypothetical protein